MADLRPVVIQDGVLKENDVVGANLATTIVPFTVNSGQEDVWLTVPTSGFVTIFNVSVYDATNSFEIIVDYRLVSANVLEIRSSSADTYSIRILGNQ